MTWIAPRRMLVDPGGGSVIDLVAVGETMLSLVSAGPLAAADVLHVTHGGAESNVCEGAVRLGLHAAWVGRLGTDAAGDRVTAELAATGVDLRWVRRDPDRPTGVMVSLRSRSRRPRSRGRPR